MPLGQAKAVIQNGIPGDSEGYEGEIRYVKDKGSVYQFIRIGNKWSSIKFIGGVSAVQQEETSQTITVQEKVIQSTNVSSIICDNIKIKEKIMDDSGNQFDITNVITHHDLNNQSHSDYLRNNSNDTLEGALIIKGGSTSATANYVLKLQSPSTGEELLFVSNPDFVGANKGVGIGVVGSAEILGNFHVKNTGTDFIVKDDGTVKVGILDLDGDLALDASAKITHGGVDVLTPARAIKNVTTINTSGIGDCLVYPLKTPLDSSTIEFDGDGYYQGHLNMSFEVIAGSIKNSHLEFNTGQDLTSTSSVIHKKITMNNSSSSPSLEVLSGYQDKIKLSESTVSVSNNIGGAGIKEHTGYCDEFVDGHTSLALCNAGASDHGDSSTGHWNTDYEGKVEIDLTTSAHQLISGNLILISDSSESSYNLVHTVGTVIRSPQYNIATITNNDGNPKITNNNQPYELNHIGTMITVSGSTVAEYNGTFPLFSNESVIEFTLNTSYEEDDSFDSPAKWRRDTSIVVTTTDYTNNSTGGIWSSVTNYADAFIGSSNDGDITLKPNSSKDVLVEDSSGVSSSTFSSGLGGSGWAISPLGSDKYSLTVEDITVRGSMSVYQLLVNQVRATNGSLVIGASVELSSSTQSSGAEGVFECSTTTEAHPFIDDDLLLCQFWDGSETKKYYIKVTDHNAPSLSPQYKFTGKFYDTSNPTSEGSWATIPSGKTLVRIGNANATNADKQGGVYLTADDTGAPYIRVWDDVDGFEDWGSSSEKVRIGNLNGIAGASGYGLWGESVYLEGEITATSGYIGDSTDGWTITSTGITSLSSNSLIGIGSGGFENANQHVYMDGAGKFSLGDKLSWDASTSSLSISGNILLSSGGTIDLDNITQATFQGVTTDYTPGDTTSSDTNTLEVRFLRMDNSENTEYYYNSNEVRITKHSSIISTLEQIAVGQGIFIRETGAAAGDNFITFEIDAISDSTNDYHFEVTKKNHDFGMTDTEENDISITFTSFSGADGANGAAGDNAASYYNAVAYKRWDADTTTPNAPTSGNGSYNFNTNTYTPPSTWSATPPPPDGDKVLWATYATYSVTPPAIIDNSTTWTTPVIFAQNGDTGPAGADNQDFSFLDDNFAALEDTLEDQTIIAGLAMNSDIVGFHTNIPQDTTATSGDGPHIGDYFTTAITKDGEFILKGENGYSYLAFDPAGDGSLTTSGIINATGGNIFDMWGGGALNPGANCADKNSWNYIRDDWGCSTNEHTTKSTCAAGHSGEWTDTYVISTEITDGKVSNTVLRFIAPTGDAVGGSGAGSHHHLRSDYITCDPTKTYKVSVWVRQTTGGDSTERKNYLLLEFKDASGALVNEASSTWDPASDEISKWNDPDGSENPLGVKTLANGYWYWGLAGSRATSDWVKHEVTIGPGGALPIPPPSVTMQIGGLFCYDAAGSTQDYDETIVEIQDYKIVEEAIASGTTIHGGGVTMDEGGAIKGGQTAYNTGDGFFLGWDANAYKFSIGNSTSSLTYDGDGNLSITGEINAEGGAFAGYVTAGNLKIGSFLTDDVEYTVNSFHSYTLGDLVDRAAIHSDTLSFYTIMSVGDKVTISGTSNYNGTFTVIETNAAFGRAILDTAYVSNESGTVTHHGLNGIYANQHSYWYEDGRFKLGNENSFIKADYLGALTISGVDLSITTSDLDDVEVISMINASSEGVKISGSKLEIDATTEIIGGANRCLFYFNGNSHLTTTEVDDGGGEYTHPENTFFYYDGDTSFTTSQAEGGSESLEGLGFKGDKKMLIQGHTAFTFPKYDENKFSKLYAINKDNDADVEESGLIPYHHSVTYVMEARVFGSDENGSEGTPVGNKGILEIGFQIFDQDANIIDTEGGTNPRLPHLCCINGTLTNADTQQSYSRATGYDDVVKMTGKMSGVSGDDIDQADKGGVPTGFEGTPMKAKIDGDRIPTYFRPYIRASVNASGAEGRAHIDFIQVYEQNDVNSSTLIEGSHIRTGSITADSIDVDTLVADTIFTDAIDAQVGEFDLLTIGDVDTHLGTDGATTIHGGNITTGNINASQCTITNINASNINAGTLSGITIDGVVFQANYIMGGAERVSEWTGAASNHLAATDEINGSYWLKANPIVESTAADFGSTSTSAVTKYFNMFHYDDPYPQYDSTTTGYSTGNNATDTQAMNRYTSNTQPVYVSGSSPMMVVTQLSNNDDGDLWEKNQCYLYLFGPSVVAFRLEMKTRISHSGVYDNGQCDIDFVKLSGTDATTALISLDTENDYTGAGSTTIDIASGISATVVWQVSFDDGPDMISSSAMVYLHGSSDSAYGYGTNINPYAVITRSYAGTNTTGHTVNFPKGYFKAFN